MEQITCDFLFKTELVTKNWINLLNKNFDIHNIEYQINYDWINIQKTQDFKNFKFDQIRFTINDQEKILIQNLTNALPRFSATISNYDFYKKIETLLELEISNEIVFGKVLESVDNILQNIDTLDSWRRKKRALPREIMIIPNPIYTNEREKEIISIESLAGHYHIMNYDDMLWFGSSWQMYFSTLYYKYIPKPLFDDFKDCHENIIFENGLRKITLHKNVMDYDLPENRQRQWSFRQQLGIDSIAHELTRSSNRIEPLNLPVIITKQNCEKGQTRVTRFLDDDDKLVSSNRAVKKEIKEYLNDGITIVFEKTETN